MTGGHSNEGAREDFREILKLVRPGARVLDIGCGEGDLLALLARDKGVDGRGLEIEQQNVQAALSRGLAVVQGDADRDLTDYPDRAFDYAILSQTLQTVRDPRAVLIELLRIAERAIVSFPNFGHWRVMVALLNTGRMPRTRALPITWDATPNIHLCTIRDFTDLCEDLDLRVEAAAAMIEGKPARPINPWSRMDTLRSEQAIFLLGRKSDLPPAAASPASPPDSLL
jgi:methionine biosynthesis protein MetW